MSDCLVYTNDFIKYIVVSGLIYTFIYIFPNIKMNKKDTILLLVTIIISVIFLDILFYKIFNIEKFTDTRTCKTICQKTNKSPCDGTFDIGLRQMNIKGLPKYSDGLFVWDDEKSCMSQTGVSTSTTLTDVFPDKKNTPFSICNDKCPPGPDSLSCLDKCMTESKSASTAINDEQIYQALRAKAEQAIQTTTTTTTTATPVTTTATPVTTTATPVTTTATPVTTTATVKPVVATTTTIATTTSATTTSAATTAAAATKPTTTAASSSILDSAQLAAENIILKARQTAQDLTNKAQTNLIEYESRQSQIANNLRNQISFDIDKRISMLLPQLGSSSQVSALSPLENKIQLVNELQKQLSLLQQKLGSSESPSTVASPSTLVSSSTVAMPSTVPLTDTQLITNYYNILINDLSEKGIIDTTDTVNINAKIDSKILSIADAIASLEQLKKSGRSRINKNNDNVYNELPYDFYSPIGEDIANEWDTGYSILNTNKWQVPIARPPLCVNTSPCKVCPSLDTSFLPYGASLNDIETCRNISSTTINKKWVAAQTS
jgi:hypothetical protein